MPVIGFLHSASPTTFAPQLAAFHFGLKEAVYIEGQNVVIDYRWAEGRFDRLPAMAADLVGRQVAVIAALGGNNSNLAAKAATDTIPIIFSSGSDPVRLGLVTSLSRPTGNITGYSFFAADIVAKQFGLLRDLVPDAKVVGLIINADSPELRDQRAIALEAAPALAFEVAVASVTTAGEIDQAFATLVEKGASRYRRWGRPGLLHQNCGNRSARGKASDSDHVLPQRVRRRWWADELWDEHHRRVSPRRDLRRSNSQGRQAR